MVENSVQKEGDRSKCNVGERKEEAKEEKFQDEENKGNYKRKVT